MEPPGSGPRLVECRAVLSALVAVAGDPLRLSTSEPSAIALATDFRFAARAVEVALELATRGRVLPTLERIADGWWARWRPVIDTLDRGRMAALLWSFPAPFLASGGARPADRTH